MPYRRRGYRKKWCRPRKGVKPWVTAASTNKGNVDEIVEEVSCPEMFCGFNVPPTRPSLRVLSLFDGIATALYVLDCLNIHVEVYYSSEVDEKAKALQRYNSHRRVTAVGPVQSLGPSRLDELGQIDLLIGGSPCSDLSLVNPHRRGLHGEDSTGRLFFNYIEIKEHLEGKALSAGHSFWWLFENTSHMEKQVCEEMSRSLGCQPTVLCASKFLPVIRRRYFWGNLSHLKNGGFPITEMPKVLDDLLPPYRNANVTKVPTLTTTHHSQYSGKDKVLPILEDGAGSPLFMTELEALFGLPPHFTDGPNLSLTDRRRLLGRSFCVPVIQHILKPLQSLYRKTTITNHPHFSRGNPLSSSQ